MIFYEDAINVSIAGHGVINGMGSRFMRRIKTYNSNGIALTKEFDKLIARKKDKYMPKGVFFTDAQIVTGFTRIEDSWF